MIFKPFFEVGEERHYICLNISSAMTIWVTLMRVTRILLLWATFDCVNKLRGLCHCPCWQHNSNLSKKCCDLTGTRFKPPSSRFRDECVTARPTGRPIAGLHWCKTIWEVYTSKDFDPWHTRRNKFKRRGSVHCSRSGNSNVKGIKSKKSTR